MEKIVAVNLKKGVAKVTLSFTARPWHDNVLGKNWKEVWENAVIENGAPYLPVPAEAKQKHFDLLKIGDIRKQWKVVKIKIYGTSTLTGEDLKSLQEDLPA